MTIEIPYLDKRGLRNFGLMAGAFISVIFGVLFPWLGENSIPWWPWLTAGVLCIWSLTVPQTLRPLYRGWMTVGLAIGSIVNRLILGIVFFGVVLPMGFIKRIVGNDAMARRLDKNVSTYRVAKVMRSSRSHMERPF